MAQEQEGFGLRWHLESWRLVSWHFETHKGEAVPPTAPLETILELLHVVHGGCYEDLAWCCLDVI